MRDLIERLERVSIGEDALGFTKRIGDLVGKMGPEKFSRDLRGKERGLGAQSISRKDPPT